MSRHGHDGLVLCLDWSAATGRIVTGGEDCKYRVGTGFILYLRIMITTILRYGTHMVVNCTAAELMITR